MNYRSPESFQIFQQLQSILIPKSDQLISVIFEVHSTVLSISLTCSLRSESVLSVWDTWDHVYSSSCIAVFQAILRVIYLNYGREF